MRRYPERQGDGSLSPPPALGGTASSWSASSHDARWQQQRETPATRFPPPPTYAPTRTGIRLYGSHAAAHPTSSPDFSGPPSLYENRDVPSYPALSGLARGDRLRKNPSPGTIDGQAIMPPSLNAASVAANSVNRLPAWATGSDVAGGSAGAPPLLVEHLIRQIASYEDRVQGLEAELRWRRGDGQSLASSPGPAPPPSTAAASRAHPYLNTAPAPGAVQWGSQQGPSPPARRAGPSQERARPDADREEDFEPGTARSSYTGSPGPASPRQQPSPRRANGVGSPRGPPGGAAPPARDPGRSQGTQARVLEGRRAAQNEKEPQADRDRARDRDRDRDRNRRDQGNRNQREQDDEDEEEEGGEEPRRRRKRRYRRRRDEPRVPRESTWSPSADQRPEPQPQPQPEDPRKQPVGETYGTRAVPMNGAWRPAKATARSDSTFASPASTQRSLGPDDERRRERRERHHARVPPSLTNVELAARWDDNMPAGAQQLVEYDLDADGRVTRDARTEKAESGARDSGRRPKEGDRNAAGVGTPPDSGRGRATPKGTTAPAAATTTTTTTGPPYIGTGVPQGVAAFPAGRFELVHSSSASAVLPAPAPHPESARRVTSVDSATLRSPLVSADGTPKRMDSGDLPAHGGRSIGEMKQPSTGDATPRSSRVTSGQALAVPGSAKGMSRQSSTEFGHRTEMLSLTPRDLPSYLSPAMMEKLKPALTMIHEYFDSDDFAQRAMTVFSHHDSDFSGSIDVKEFHPCVIEMVDDVGNLVKEKIHEWIGDELATAMIAGDHLQAPKPTQADSDVIIEAFDSNKDGELQVGEFTAAVSSLYQTVVVGLISHGVEAIERERSGAAPKPGRTLDFGTLVARSRNVQRDANITTFKKATVPTYKEVVAKVGSLKGLVKRGERKDNTKEVGKIKWTKGSFRLEGGMLYLFDTQRVEDIPAVGESKDRMDLYGARLAIFSVSEEKKLILLRSGPNLSKTMRLQQEGSTTLLDSLTLLIIGCRESLKNFDDRLRLDWISCQQPDLGPEWIYKFAVLSDDFLDLFDEQPRELPDGVEHSELADWHIPLRNAFACGDQPVVNDQKVKEYRMVIYFRDGRTLRFSDFQRPTVQAWLTSLQQRILFHTRAMFSTVGLAIRVTECDSAGTEKPGQGVLLLRLTVPQLALELNDRTLWHHTWDELLPSKPQEKKAAAAAADGTGSVPATPKKANEPALLRFKGDHEVYVLCEEPGGARRLNFVLGSCRVYVKRKDQGDNQNTWGR